MSVQRVIELIRKGEVVLFCGAGMSLYAGYPSGSQLAQKIYASMTDEEKECLNENLALPDLAEEYVNLKLGKRNALLSICKEAFLKPPTANHLHLQISRIAQIKTVITTNYDELFENAYGENCSVVKASTDIPYLSKDKVQVLKIHGDLSMPNSVLICKSDYTKFFDSQQQELLWTLVKERLATKNVLFVGYSLEDINIESVFRKVTEELGSNSKEAFLLSPNEKDHKIQALVRKGIHYINSYAEPFFEELEQSVKNNVNQDFKDGWIDADTYRKILKHYDLSPSLVSRSSGFQMNSVKGLNRPVTGELQFSIPAEDKETIKRVNDLFSSRDIQPVTLNDANVSEMLMKLNGIKFPSPIKGGMKFGIKPGIEGEIDIVFNNGREYEDVKIEVYKTLDHLVFVIPLKCAKLTVKVPHDTIAKFPRFDLTINFKRVDEYKRIKDEISTYEFILDFISAGGLTVSNAKMKKMQFGLGVDQSVIKDCDKHLDYFYGLKEVERYFDVKFGEVKIINNETYNTLCWLRDIISGEEQISDWQEELVVQGTIPEKTLFFLGEFDKKEEKNFVHTHSEPLIINFHDCDIQVGYQITRIIEPYVVNRSEVENDPTIKIIVKSKSEQKAVTFTKEKK